MNEAYERGLEFKKKYPITISWRIKSHADIINRHLNPGEKILYVFLGQKNTGAFDVVNTNMIVLTDRRLMLASKRLLFGYYFKSITPDMYNDLTINKGLIWGKVIIDTIKEKVILTNISASALPEIETSITDYMMNEKRKFSSTESE